MKITYTVTSAVGSLTHSFKDEKFVKGFQEIEDMLGDKAEATPRTILLKNYMDKNGLWGKLYDSYFITLIEKTDDGEHWYFNKVI
jgi:hypothetical protein